ncbi:hypothetical protein O7627_27495 [Solwaraspora sp. WMMD1047]|uniref:hypothetical protein n=1 Tax=Solwaraspora sp. WMMD1047 TaxID=3016102 RepID=UPI002415E6C9|nr:hypothetical protein [Solwaraspora sp. WMMD1047]MDG4833022.1 hypothetical protein [Solwaraspora sp. WMMD1047]
MEHYEPGYPVDNRTDGMRRRAFQSHLGDFELAAARVVARLTGERVVLQDDNSAPAMVDIRIDYPDRSPGYVEVVTDIDRSYAAMASAIRGQVQVPTPELGRVWYVTVSPAANIKQLKRELPDRLANVQLSGALFETVAWEQHLNLHDVEAVRALAASGVVRLASRPVVTDEEGKAIMYGKGAGGPAGQNWDAFNDWLATFLHDPRQVDVRAKLAATDAVDRHAFIGMSFSTPWAAYHTLSDDYQGLPSRPPKVPAEVTHVWVWSYPIGRCIAWFPETGWFDPSTRWATA